MALRDRLNPHFAGLAPFDYAALAARMDSGLTMLGWADPFRPDACLPAHVIDATKAALDAGQTHYTLPIGAPALRRAIAAKLAAFNGLTVDADRELIVTPGSDTGLYYAMRILLAPGDEVLNPVPSYPSNHGNAGIMGAVSVPVPLREETGWQIEIEALEARLTDRTKLIVLTQPNNPTTTVHRRKNLEALGRFVVDHDLFVVADHAFEDALYDGRELVTIASLPGLWERTISVFSASKGLGLSGYRVGYNVACAELMAVMHSAAVNVIGTTNTFAQAGALAAYENPGYMADYARIYDRRRQRAFASLNAIDGVRCALPESGFMAWVNVSALGSSDEVTRHLAEHAGVIVSPGRYYGPGGEGWLRIMLGSLRDESAFDAAWSRVESALRTLGDRNA